MRKLTPPTQLNQNKPFDTIEFDFSYSGSINASKNYSLSPTFHQPNIELETLSWYPYILMCRCRYSCGLGWSKKSFLPRNRFRLRLWFWIILVWPRTPICSGKTSTKSKQEHTTKTKSWTLNLVLRLTVWIRRVSKIRNLQKKRISES